MKRLLICLMLFVLLPLGAQGDELPPSLAAVFAQDGWSGWAPAVWEVSEELSVVIQRKDQTNTLCVLTPAGSGWKLAAMGTKAIYQGERLPHAITLDGDGAFDLWYNAGQGENRLRFAVNRGIWRVSRLEIKDEGLAYDTIHVYSDKLIYASSNKSKNQTEVYGVTNRDLDSFSLKALPRTPHKARAVLSTPPQLPANSQLRATPVDFRGGQKFAVYAGPGEDYLRPVKGKCVVSTNDWIQVFGQENGWLLIQYARSSQQLRFGYISASALKKSNVSINDMDDLSFTPTPVYAARDTAVTDDPLLAQEPLASVPQGSEMTYLDVMGEWAHVEASLGGERLRGFVPLADLQFPAPSRVYPVAKEFSGYRVSGQAELTQEELTLSLHVTGEEAQKVTAYQIYLNNTLLTAVSLVQSEKDQSLIFTFSLNRLPEVIGLCPVDAEGYPNPREALILQP